MPEREKNELTGGKVLARNTIYSFLGQGIPLLVAIFAMPLLIKELGTERFGILTIAWMVISYFSLFDLGLGRALTQLVAEKLEINNDAEIAELIWTAIIIMFCLGALGSFCVASISQWLVYSTLKVPKEIQDETLKSFYLLSASIPIVTSSAGLVGVLSALQRFDLINIVKTPLSILIFVGPLLIIPFSKSLVATIGVLIALRVFAWLAYAAFCIHSFPELKIENIRIQKKQIYDLLKFGSWMTISNIVGPVMMYLDRFLIGSVISVAAVAYYTTPYEIVTKLWLISGAFVGVLFPAFSSTYINEYGRTVELFKKGIKYIFFLVYPITCFIIIFGYKIIDIWIGEEFANNSFYVLQWLAVGVFINSLSQIPFALIQAVGRPDVTAKLHIVEMPIYLFLVWWMLKSYGISGVAFAWSIRVLIDAALLFSVSQMLVREIKSFNIKIVTYATLFPIFALISSLLAKQNFKAQILMFSLVMCIFCFVSWFFMANLNERKLVKKVFCSRRFI